ncbi:SAM-dependent methyltransferase [Agromyces terreus]|uniref:SAM-dependent methyltransferase n=1 Tax=Agromyces terreus TaxID=424795 RepID=A0A9X2GV81_9MICO|nr:class I SAM-dependent methyltransferase [Agromyces terreus]MCP2369615.1 SAM-dependent methyltransferase [Agromyces terreus]
MDVITNDDLDDLERELIGRVRGRVLEIGAGDGENFGAFHPDVVWTGLEPDAGRRAELATRAREWRHASTPLGATAEHIPLPDAAVDAVVGTYVLCSVRNVAVVLAELRRVLVPGGRVVFVDHVAAPRGTFKRAVQNVATPLSAKLDHGCHWNRDPQPLLEAAGFAGVDVRRLRVRSFPLGPVPVLLYEGVAPR